MTRKHFRELADALDRTHAHQEIVKAIADVCANHNDLFDRERFYKAAGLVRDEVGGMMVWYRP